MSSISSTTLDRNTAEYLRKERERAEAREEQLVKQYEARLAKEKERHASAVSQLEERYEGNLEKYKSQKDELYTDQDFKHKREIEELKKSYGKQLEKLRYENDRRNHRLDQFRNTEKEILESRNEHKFNHLNKKYSDHLTKNREGYGELLSENRESFQKALKEQKMGMNEAHYNNKKQITKGFTDQLNSTQRHFDNYRQHSKEQSDFNNKRNEKRFKQVTDNHVRYVNHLKQSGDETQQDMREDYKATLQEQKLDYLDQFGRERDRIYSEVRTRQENEVEYLQGKLSDAQRQNQRDKIKANKRADRQIRHMQKQNQRASKSYHQAQQRFINDVRQERAKDKAQDYEHWQGITSKAAKNYHDRLGMTERVLREHYNEEVDRLNQQRMRDKSSADLKVQLTKQMSRRDMKRVLANRDENLRIIQQKYKDDFNKMQESMKDEKRTTINKLHDMLVTSNHEHKSKLLDIEAGYLERMDDLAMQKNREKRIMAETYGRLSREKNQSGKFELDNMKSIYEQKIAKIKNSYEEQLNQMNDIHAEQMDQAYEHIIAKKEFINRKA